MQQFLEPVEYMLPIIEVGVFAFAYGDGVFFTWDDWGEWGVGEVA